MPHSVVITGIGPVTSIGIGRERFWEALLEKRIAVSPIPPEFEQLAPLHSRWYVPLPQVSLSDHGLTIAYESALQPEDRLAILGTQLALEDAGLVASIDLDRCSILLGTGLGGLETAFESFLAHRIPPELLMQLPARKKPKFSRMVIPATMPNSPAAWVSICFGIHGQTSTLNASCASGTIAVGEAFRRIRDGYDEVVLCGGVENMRESSGAIMRGFDKLGALTRSVDGFPRPFSTCRSGFLFAEGGACLLVLESYAHARRRNARIYAEIADYRACSDAANIIQIEKEGSQITGMLSAIAAGHDIDYLNAHGTGTEPNDDIEARAIQKVFGDHAHQPFINSTKGLLGHTLGASGAIEAAVTALTIHHGIIPGNITDNPIENLNLTSTSIEHSVSLGLSTSFGFGGHNAALLIRKMAHDE